MTRKNLLPTLLIIAMMTYAVIVSAFDDIEKHRSCAQCGMDRKAYGYSRVLVVYEDGTTKGFCSLHCAVDAMSANKALTVKEIQVADRNSRSLLSASEAQWVVGGSKRGVMTQQPKWAFLEKYAAEAFMRAYGGKLATWNEVLLAAQEETTHD